MKLWTIQSLERWQRLEREGVLRAYRFEPEFYCTPVFEWMRQQLRNRVGPPPDEGLYPIWAWYQWSNAKARRPDLRFSGHRSRGERAVRMEIGVASDDVLLSDFSLWHFPLNLSPIPEQAEDEESDDMFEKRLQEAGFNRPISFDDFESVMQHAELGPSFRKSWEKIFDLDWCCPGLSDPKDGKRIQAVFWELRRENVRCVDFFTAR